MLLEKTTSGFTLSLDGRVILSHSAENPSLFIGHGEERMDMYCGHFDIEDYVVERVALAHSQVDVEGGTVRLASAPGQPVCLILKVDGDSLCLNAPDTSINRFWLRTVAEKDEHIWGGGEQMSYFDLRGRRFPLWTSEPGQGRDKTTQITFQSDVTGKAGGDYYNTNYPQPTYISSRRYALHVDTTAYAVFDLRRKGFHEVEVWEVPEKIEFFAAATFRDLVGKLSLRFGRQPELPDWPQGRQGLVRAAGEDARRRRESLGAVVRGLGGAASHQLRRAPFLGLGEQ